MLAVAELTVGILAACFPVYRPLMRWATGKGKVGSSSRGTDYAASKGRQGLGPSFAQGHGVVAASVSTDGSMAGMGRGITVTDEIELIRHDPQANGWSEVPDDDTDGLFRPSAAPGLAR